MNGLKRLNDFPKNAIIDVSQSSEYDSALQIETY